MTVHVALGGASGSSAVPDFVHPARTARPEASSAESGLDAVADAIAKARRIVVVCGAGISVAAGIPDFRSNEGLFRTLKDANPTSLLSSGKDLFDSSVFSVPERASLFYKMIAQLTDLSASARPTAFHHLLKTLDERGQLLRLYTQNIDNLEEKAGLECGVPVFSTSGATLGGGAGALNAGANANANTTVGLAAASADSASATVSAATATPPRCVPLHGTLKQLVCQRCAHAIPLLKEEEGESAELALLASGLSVACPACTSSNSARRLEGKRDRGVGRMRPSVVLYGEEHLSGEGVGECVRRDLIGLGDVTSASSSSSASSSQQDAASSSKPPSTSSTSASTPLPSTSPTKSSTKTPSPRARASAQPDLLIVAGSSLKVPGTKRIVREFAKAVQAKHPRKDKDANANSNNNDRTSREASPSNGSSSASSSASPGKQSTVSERTLVDASSSDNESTNTSTSAPVEVDVERELRANPPRTIYLNLDFPVPTRDWKGVFDVWVQGDVQGVVDTVRRRLDAHDASSSSLSAAVGGGDGAADDVSVAGSAPGTGTGTGTGTPTKAAPGVKSRKRKSQASLTTATTTAGEALAGAGGDEEGKIPSAPAKKRKTAASSSTSASTPTSTSISTAGDQPKPRARAKPKEAKEPKAPRARKSAASAAASADMARSASAASISSHSHISHPELEQGRSSSSASLDSVGLGALASAAVKTEMETELGMRGRAKVEDTDESGILAAAEGLLALSVSPSPPLHYAQQHKRRSSSGVVVQILQPQQSHANIPHPHGSSLDSASPNGERRTGHKRVRSDSGSTSALKLEVSLPSSAPLVASSRAQYHPSHSQPPPQLHPSVAYGSGTGRVQPGLIVRPGAGSYNAHGGYASSRTSSSSPYMSAPASASTTPSSAAASVADVMPAKKRARRTASSKTANSNSHSAPSPNSMSMSTPPPLPPPSQASPANTWTSLKLPSVSSMLAEHHHQHHHHQREAPMYSLPPPLPHPAGDRDGGDSRAHERTRDRDQESVALVRKMALGLRERGR